MEEILKNAKISLAATQKGGTLDYVLKVANKTTLIA
jgi:hypothetical protein